MHRFSLDQLSTLLALVSAGSFEAAAAQLHVTSSAVSQRVKTMEITAGRVLVQRTTPVRLTSAGDVLLRFARQIELLEADALRALDVDDTSAAPVTVSLAVNADSLATWFLDALAGLGSHSGRADGSGIDARVNRVTGPDRGAKSDGDTGPGRNTRPDGDTGPGGDTRPGFGTHSDRGKFVALGARADHHHDADIAFDLHREDQENTTTLLRAGTVMAAVTSTREAVQGCTVEALGVMRDRAVATPGLAAHWLGAPADLSRLASAPVVIFDCDDDLQQRFLIRHAGTGPSGAVHLIPTSNDFARAVIRGFGWGLLPEQQCLAELGAGTLIELAPEHPLDVPLYWQRWNIASPLLDAVSTAVRDGARTALLPL